jgi:hypothetical protein
MPYNFKRAADRVAASAEIEALAAECGADLVERDDHNREIYLTFRKAGVSVSVWFEADDISTGFLAPWFGAERPLSDAFGGAVSGGMPDAVNTIHRRKATTYATTFEQFKERLAKGWRMLDTPEAFAD